MARSPRADVLARRLAAALGELLDRLGLPGWATVELREGHSARALRLRVHGQLVPHPRELLRRMWLAQAPPALWQLADAADPEQAPDAWLSEYAATVAATGGDADWTLAAEVIGRVTVQAVTERPACLIGRAQAERYVAVHAGPAGVEAAVDDVLPIVRALLELGATVDDGVTVLRAAAEGEARGRPHEDSAEAVLAAAGPRTVEVRLHPDALGGAAGADDPLPADDERLEPDLREELRDVRADVFEWLGLELPKLQVTARDRLRANAVEVKVGDRRALPLVAPSNTRLRHVLDMEIARHAGLLVDATLVERRLAQLAGIYPALVDAALVQLSLGTLTRVLRGLIEERVSIVDLRTILERLLEHDTVPLDVRRYAALDDRLPVRPEADGQGWRDRLEFLRAGLGDRIAMTCSADGEHVDAVMFQPALERRIANGELGDGEQERVREEVWREVARLRDTSVHPVVCTSPAARAAVRALLQPELPELAVVSLRELPDNIAVTTLATVGRPARRRFRPSAHMAPERPPAPAEQA